MKPGYYRKNQSKYFYMDVQEESKSEFPVITEATRSCDFTKEINLTSTCSQYFNKNSVL